MTAAPGRARATLAIRPYRLLFYSATVVIFGVMGQAVARGWLARELTGNNTGLGGVMLAFGAAMLVATPFGGVAADRYPKRSVLLGSLLALVVSAASIGVAVVADVISYWMLVVASAVQAAAFAFYLPARIALISEYVPAHLLQSAVVISQTSMEGSRVVSPALAGVLISVSWFGIGGVFLAASALSALAAAVVLLLPPGIDRRASDRSPLDELVDAGRYLRGNRTVGAIAALTVGVVMIGFPYLAFLPTIAEERFSVGASGYGVMSGAAGLGAVTAGSRTRHGTGAHDRARRSCCRRWRSAHRSSASGSPTHTCWRWWHWWQSARAASCSRRRPRR
jgi:MFS family permease